MMQCNTDVTTVPAETPATRCVVITINAPVVPTTVTRPALSAGIVVDRSGSMSGPKLDLAKAAAADAVRQLSDRDYCAVVAYDHAVTVVAPCAAATPMAQRHALEALHNVTAGGTTNLEAGWLEGVRQIDHAPSPIRRRVMVLSDGLANAGECRPDVLIDEARRLHARDVTTSTFGIGEHFDEHLLSQLAIAGGGHFYYVQRPEQIRELLASEFGESLNVWMRGATVVLTHSDAITVEPLTTYRVTRGPMGTTIHFGDLTSGQQLTLALLVRVSSLAPGAMAEMEMVLAGDAQMTSSSQRIHWLAGPRQAGRSRRRAHAVAWSVAEAIVAHARSRAVVANRDGDFAAVHSAIAQGLERLRQLRPLRGLDELEQVLQNEGRELSAHVSLLRRKQLHSLSHARLSSRLADGRSQKWR